MGTAFRPYMTVHSNGQWGEPLARDPPLTESQIIEYPEGHPVDLQWRRYHADQTSAIPFYCHDGLIDP